MRFVIAANLLGLPAISVPVSDTGLRMQFHVIFVFGILFFICTKTVILELTANLMPRNRVMAH